MKNNLIQKDKIFICKNQNDQISITMVATASHGISDGTYAEWILINVLSWVPSRQTEDEKENREDLAKDHHSRELLMPWNYCEHKKNINRTMESVDFRRTTSRSEEQMSSPQELRGTSEPTSEKNLWISTSQKDLVLPNSRLLGYRNWPYSARLLDAI